MRTPLAIAAAAAALTTSAAAAPPAELPTPTAPSEPVLRTTSERAWTLALRYRAANDGFANRGRRGRYAPGAKVSGQVFDIGRAAVVVPAIDASATHTAAGEASAVWRIDGRAVDKTPTLLEGYQNGETLARLDANSITGVDSFEVWIDLPMRARSVDFDESAALEIGWPGGPWPALCASALQPQLAIDPANAHVRAFVERTVGLPPYADPPALIAKKLAAGIINRFQPNGLGFEYDRSGNFAGIEFDAIDFRGTNPFLGITIDVENVTAERFTGSPADMTALYVASLRAAGVPSRPVIGYDLFSAPEASDEELDSLGAECGERFKDGDTLQFPRLVYWAEFALYDEDANTLEWVPVDVFAQRRLSSRARPIDQRWFFFGNNPCGEARLPISFHFFPPTTVVGMGAPLSWGWISEPEVPLLTQSLRVWASGTPVTTSDD